MRILILNYEFPPLGGGAANATFHLLREFAKTDIKADLITSSIGKHKEESFSDNINIYYLNIGKDGNPHYQTNKNLISYSLRARAFAKKMIKQNNYHLVHAFFGIPCGYIAMKLGLPYIVSLRGSDVPFYNERFRIPDKYLFRRLSKKIWKNSKHVIANSHGLKSLALETSPKQDIGVIHNGVDTAFFRSAPRKKNPEFTILFTGRLIERKGIHHLIEAFSRLNTQKDCRLIIIGTGKLEDELKGQAKILGQENSVTFTGALSREDLPAHYRQSDVFVLPSLNEGMSNSLLEAIASGLPVITTATGGSKELIKGNGIIIEKESPVSILGALTHLKNNKAHREEMGFNSLWVADRMTWERVARSYIQLYAN